MTPQDFEERRARRIERLRTRAEQKEREGNALVGQANQMSDAIPMGQPILVGHHSEKRDRRYRERMHNKMRKGIDTLDYAKQLEARAEAAKQNTAVFSDDPNAAEKLADKLARLEERQKLMVTANKLVRKNDREGLLNLGFSEARINQLFTPDFLGRLGFPDYAIKNNGARIRDIRQRLAHIEQHSQDITTEKQIGDIRIVDNVEENRVQLFFPGKPSEAVRNELKQNGFRWAHTEGCWQRYRGSWAWQIAEDIVKKCLPPAEPSA